MAAAVSPAAQPRASGADRVVEPAAASAQPALRVRGVSKRFGAVTALEDVSLDLRAGEAVGLVGDNGAGKSTLLKIMSGVHPPDEGSIEVDGRAVSFASPAAAREAGIEAVYQDLALVEDMTVAENLFLGREMRLPGLAGRLGLINRKAMHARAAEAIDQLRIKIPGISDTMVRLMSGGQRQGVAIARSIMWGRKVLLLDEPTAALGVEQQDEVERLIHGLQQHDLPMMIIAHNMPLVFRLTQRIVVLRHGRVVADTATAETTPEAVVAHITGAARLRERLSDG